MSELPPAPAIDPNQLVRQAMPIVERHAQSLLHAWRGLVDLDELRSAGAIGLSEAARRFDPALGARFEDYAASRVRGAMLDTVRGLTRQGRIQWAAERGIDRYMEEYREEYDVLVHDDAELARRIEKLADNVLAVQFAAAVEEAAAAGAEDPVAERQEYARVLHALGEAVRRLDRDEQDVLAWMFRDGMDLEQIGRRLGKSKTAAWKRVQRILERLRKLLGALGVMEAPEPRDLAILGAVDWLPERLAGGRVRRS